MLWALEVAESTLCQEGSPLPSSPPTQHLGIVPTCSAGSLGLPWRQVPSPQHYLTPASLGPAMQDWEEGGHEHPPCCHQQVTVHIHGLP